VITFLLISLFLSMAAAVYFFGRHQLLSKDNQRLVTDNGALRDKLLAKHGFTALHETAEVKVSRQGQVIDIRPPIQAAIQAEEEAEEREYTLSQEKQEELREEAQRRAS
jgi:hypothetical protein